METKTISSALHSPFLPSPTLPARRPVRVALSKKRLNVIFASRKQAFGWDFGGGLVDENMILLRKRIHEMKMAERNYEPPSDWSEWEKRYFASYSSDVCEMLGLLQIILMNTRPSWVIGFMVMLTLSVPTSAILIMFYLIDASRSMHL